MRISFYHYLSYKTYAQFLFQILPGFVSNNISTESSSGYLIVFRIQIKGGETKVFRIDGAKSLIPLRAIVDEPDNM